MRGQEIEIAGVGPIHESSPLRIPLGKPGLKFVRGRNGDGKSSALDAIRALTLGSGALSLNRDSQKGYVRCGDVVVTVSKTTRRTGDELVFGNLSGVDPVAIVDPGIKDPEAADSHRIKLLAKLVGAEVAHEQFGELVGGMDNLRAHVGLATLEVEGAPERAGAFKRDFERVARKLEESAGVARVRAEGLRQSIEGRDLNAESDAAKLATGTEEAIRALSRAEGEAAAAAKRQARYSDAKARIEAATSANGVSGSLDLARARLSESQELVRLRGDEELAASVAESEARRAYELAVSTHNMAKERTKSARSEVDSAQRLVAQAVEAERAVEDARALADAGPGDAGPSAETIANLRRSVDSARKRHENGVLVRQAKEQAKLADEAAEQAAEIALQAAKFREAAAGCEELLARAIQSMAPAGLRIRGGRLMAANKRGENVVFEELSFGERLKLILPLAIAAVGTDGVLVLGQEATEGLDPINLELLDTELRAHNAHMIGARCDAGELRVETFHANGAAQ